MKAWVLPMLNSVLSGKSFVPDGFHALYIECWLIHATSYIGSRLEVNYTQFTACVILAHAILTPVNLAQNLTWCERNLTQNVVLSRILHKLRLTGAGAEKAITRSGRGGQRHFKTFENRCGILDAVLWSILKSAVRRVKLLLLCRTGNFWIDRETWPALGLGRDSVRLPMRGFPDLPLNGINLEIFGGVSEDGKSIFQLLFAESPRADPSERYARSNSMRLQNFQSGDRGRALRFWERKILQAMLCWVLEKG